MNCVFKTDEEAPGAIQMCLGLGKVPESGEQISKVILDRCLIASVLGLLKVETGRRVFDECAVSVIPSAFGNTEVVEHIG